MKYTLIGGATLALLMAGTTSLAQAQLQNQAQLQKEQRPGGGPSQAPRVERAPQAAPQRSAPRVERAPQVERTPRAERAPKVERTPRAEPRSIQQPKRAEPRREAPKRVERPQKGPERPQRAEPRREQKESPKQATPQRKDVPEKGVGTPVNRLQATNEQRVRVREQIFRERKPDRISRGDFKVAVAVGSRVERRHHRHLHRLTPAILAFAPIYRGYSYLVVEDSICIVDPESYVVVDVIPADAEYAYGPGGRRVQLALSAEEMRFVYASVPRDQVADVRVRLALGAEVPRRVDLLGFPTPVVERIPQLDTFRYIVVEDDIVIVDPNDRAVALVITE